MSKYKETKEGIEVERGMTKECVLDYHGSYEKAIGWLTEQFLTLADFDSKPGAVYIITRLESRVTTDGDLEMNGTVNELVEPYGASVQKAIDHFLGEEE